jgi:hypothetical protein
MSTGQKIQDFVKKYKTLIITIVSIICLTLLIVLSVFLYKKYGSGDSTGVSTDNSKDNSIGDSTGDSTGNSTGGDSTGVPTGGDSTGDSTGGDPTGVPTGGDPTGDTTDNFPDHWTPHMYNKLKNLMIKKIPALKSDPKKLNCIVNNVVVAYPNPQFIKSEDELEKTFIMIMMNCNNNTTKDPGYPKFIKSTHVKPSSVKPPSVKPPTSPIIANDIMNNCVGLTKKQPPINCHSIIMDCAGKNTSCISDNNCLNDIDGLAQDYCTQIHGKKLPIKPAPSDHSGFYSYCDEKCNCVKTKATNPVHPPGHDLYTDPICSGSCDGAKCHTLHSIKHGVF